jgi:hypothetical protein
VVTSNSRSRHFLVVSDHFRTYANLAGGERTRVGRVPKKKKHPKRSTQRSGHPVRRATRHDPDDDWDLLDEVDFALAQKHPLLMLRAASGLLDLLDPRNDNPFDRAPKPERVPVADLLNALATHDSPAATAMAWTVAQLSGDELLRTRVVRDLGARSFLLPSWMHQLSKLEIVAAEQVTDQVNDGYDIVVHSRLAGHDITTVTFIDFNLGMIVKDNLLSDRDLENFNEVWKEHADLRNTAIEPLTPADARARISDAIEVGAMTLPATESEDWPASRPLLEWILRQMPDGGTGFVQPEWSDEDREALLSRFLDSPYGAAFDRPDDRSIVGDLIWYRADYGYGDPLRWSPTAIEILLLDWYPRKIVADQQYLLRMPSVLRDFVQFAHAEIGLDQELTAEALGAIEFHERGYRSIIGKPRRQGPEAILEAMGALDPPDNDWDDDDLEEDELYDHGDRSARPSERTSGSGPPPLGRRAT